MRVSSHPAQETFPEPKSDLRLTEVAKKPIWGKRPIPILSNFANEQMWKVAYQPMIILLASI